MRRSTFAIAENGGFISTTLGVIAGVEMIVDLRGVEAGDGDAGKEMGEQPGAGLGQFVENERRRRRARRGWRASPVPAEGSSTRSAGVIAAAALAARPSAIGVENC